MYIVQAWPLVYIVLEGHVPRGRPCCWLHGVGDTELVNKTLRTFSLLHDSLLVVLPERPAQFIVVHGGSVLTLSPQLRYSHRVLYLKDACKRNGSDLVTIS